MTDELTIEMLADPVWRLHNLYHVKNDDGEVVPFTPSPEQEIIIRAIYVLGLKKIVILKARQLGMSTVIDIIALDKALWEEGVQIAIVDLTQSDASKKLENKVKLAWNQLPRELRDGFEIGKDSGKQFQIRPVTFDASATNSWSEIQAGMNARGDTFQFIHISEWGAIQHEDEARSTEIVTGALPAAKNGIVVVETTWKGGKFGHLWDIVHNAITVTPENRTDADFTLFFFPWYTDARYHITGNFDQIDPETTQYLDQVEEESGVVLLPTQRLWYYKVAMAKGFFRFREYPSTLDECFKGFIEGAVYQDQILKAYAEGRITNFPYDNTRLVHTVWDLGAPLNTTTWFFQIIGREVHFIDVIAQEDLDMNERAAKILAKGYPLGQHFLPHDALAKERSGNNFAEVLAQYFANLVVLPRPMSIFPGIDHARSMFSRFRFNLATTEAAVEALSVYRMRKDKVNNVITEVPVHDAASHIADPIRVLAEADMLNMFTEKNQGVITPHNSRNRRRNRFGLARI